MRVAPGESLISEETIQFIIKPGHVHSDILHW